MCIKRYLSTKAKESESTVLNTVDFSRPRFESVLELPL